MSKLRSKSKTGPTLLLRISTLSCLLMLACSTGVADGRNPSKHKNSSAFARSTVPEKTYESTVTIQWLPISDKDLKYGEQEVRKMLKDRPEMADFIAKKPGLLNLAARCYGGALCGRRIRWNSREDYTKATNAQHSWGTSGIQIFINKRNEKGDLRIGESCWADFFYEVFNSSRCDERMLLRRRVLKDECSREEFITLSAKYEYLAELQLFQFFKKTVEPNFSMNQPKAKRYICSPLFWGYLVSKVPFEVWRKGVVDENKKIEYPDGHFGRMFDRIRFKTKSQKLN